MPQFTFIGESRTEEDGHGQRCTLQFEADCWNEVLPKLKDFLVGCGYVFPEGEFGYHRDGDEDTCACCCER